MPCIQRIACQSGHSYCFDSRYCVLEAKHLRTYPVCLYDFDGGAVSKSQLRIKSPNEGDRVQHLLNGLISAMKHNEASA